MIHDTTTSASGADQHRACPPPHLVNTTTRDPLIPPHHFLTTSHRTAGTILTHIHIPPARACSSRKVHFRREIRLNRCTAKVTGLPLPQSAAYSLSFYNTSYLSPPSRSPLRKNPSELFAIQSAMRCPCHQKISVLGGEKARDL